LLPGDRTTTDSTTAADWASALRAYQEGSEDGINSLYLLFRSDALRCLCHQIALQDMEDTLHDAFTDFLQAIRAGRLRDPERARSYAYTILKRRTIRWIHGTSRARLLPCVEEVSDVLVDEHYQNPEEAAERNERIGLVIRLLRSMDAKDREIITRFFLLDETSERLCADLHLNDSQFRLAKSRAKGRLMGRFIAMGLCAQSRHPAGRESRHLRESLRTAQELR
jgi:RNA polymerase sigma-70 factor, ECF subfamily